MPANLPPQYHEAEQRYRSAKVPAEKVAALQQMLAATPKHKGTDHLRADLRAKVARALEELERPSHLAGGRPGPYALRKEEAGQAVLIGLPNVGKSQLLASLTGASSKVASYPFTTQAPLPGVFATRTSVSRWWIPLLSTTGMSRPAFSACYAMPTCC